MVLRKLIFVWTLTSLFKDTAGTVCSDAVTDGTTVLNMCEDGNAVGDHVVIDTYGSSVYRKDGGSINCSCTSTLVGLPDGTLTTVGYGPVQLLYPPTGCGSSLTVSAQVAAFPNVSTNTYLCTVGSNTLNAVNTNDTFTVIWQSGVNGSTSSYCISLTRGAGSSLSTKCNPAFNTAETSPTSSGTMPTTKTPRTTSRTRTTSTTSTTMMTSLMTTTSTTTTDPAITITSNISGGTNVGEDKTSSAKPTGITEATTIADNIKDNNLDTTVIIAIAAGGVVFLVICIVIAVMCSRTRRKPNKHRETESAVNHNVLYEVTGAPSTNTATNHVVTPSGDIYAQVARHSKIETTNSKEQSHKPEQEKDHVMTPSGDLYAQVKKLPKVETSNSEKQSDKPEQEIEHVTTPSGDIYAQVERHSKVKTAVS